MRGQKAQTVKSKDSHRTRWKPAFSLQCHIWEACLFLGVQRRGEGVQTLHSHNNINAPGPISSTGFGSNFFLPYMEHQNEQVMAFFKFLTASQSR